MKRVLMVLIASILLLLLGSSVGAFVAPGKRVLPASWSEHWKLATLKSSTLVPANQNLCPATIKSISSLSSALNGGNNESVDAATDSYREQAGIWLQLDGLQRSIANSILTDITQFRVWEPKVGALKAYLASSGVEEEISPALSDKLLSNIKILGRLQQEALAEKDRRDDYLSTSVGWDSLPPMEEAKIYSKYAISCYGDRVIQAAKADVHGSLDIRLGLSTKKRVAEHVGLEESDIVAFHLNHGGKADKLRHFVAINHARKAVVVAIRGTFNLSEVVTDITGFTQPFCGGEAHADIACMTLKLWEHIRKTVLEQLEKYPEYELILTGHSLGGGAANLLNILLHEDNNRRVGGRKVRCLAYASPPVYSPLSQVPEAVQDGVNYIHQMDDVPFLCGYSVRHLFNRVAILEHATTNMDKSEFQGLVRGDRKLSPSVADQIRGLSPDVLSTKQGVEMIFIPVKASVWIQRTESGTYDAKLCDPELLAKSPIFLDPNRSYDHFPARYERCFKDC